MDKVAEKENIAIGISAPRALWAMVREVAREDRRTVSNWVRCAMEERLERASPAQRVGKPEEVGSRAS